MIANSVEYKKDYPKSVHKQLKMIKKNIQYTFLQNV